VTGVYHPNFVQHRINYDWVEDYLGGDGYNQSYYIQQGVVWHETYWKIRPNGVYLCMIVT
jgi:hypothetical protein